MLGEIFYEHRHGQATLHFKLAVNTLFGFVECFTAKVGADNLKVPPARIALAWMLSKKSITSPIIGARTIEQLQQVIGVTDILLTETEIQALDQVSESF